MNINITPALRIDADFSVQALHTFKEGRRKGQSEWRDVSFHYNLRDALLNIVLCKRVDGEDLARVNRTLARLTLALHAVDRACEGFITTRQACDLDGRVFSDGFPDTFWSNGNGRR